MGVYRNDFFNLELEFPVGWKYRSWRNRPLTSPTSEFSQLSDDDIPETPDGYKFLFTAMKTMRNSASLPESTLSMEVHYRPNGFDLNKVKKKHKNETMRKYEEFSFKGKEGQSLFVIIGGNGDFPQSIQKVIVWKVQPKIWLGACMRNNSLLSLEEQEGIFKRLQCAK